MDAATGKVYLVSGMTQRGRVERVLDALRARGFTVQLVRCDASGAMRLPPLGSITADDAFVLHVGGARHRQIDAALSTARAGGARRLMIHSLNLGRIFEFLEA